MKIKNKPFWGTDTKYRGNLASSNWTLCVGAGVSYGLVPTWQELTRRVINRAFGTTYDVASFQTVIQETRWSLDALLQGAANKLEIAGNPPDAFGDLLEESLYEDILSEAGKANAAEGLIDALNNPRWLRKEEVLKLVDFFENGYPDSTLVLLSRALARGKEAKKGPQAIINFNADTLLYALLDLFLIKEHARRIKKWEFPPFAFARTLRGIDGIDAKATPIFHCHGAVTPTPGKRTKKSKRRDAREHLVFTEADYLNIAGNVATWAQALFLFHVQCSRMLIVGHSLSDPNIRKWLGWSLSSSIEEMSVTYDKKEFTPRHIWVAKCPSDATIQEVQEISLLHLGVRVCWVKDWSEIGATLENLLAL